MTAVFISDEGVIGYTYPCHSLRYTKNSLNNFNPRESPRLTQSSHSLRSTELQLPSTDGRVHRTESA